MSDHGIDEVRQGSDHFSREGLQYIVSLFHLSDLISDLLRQGVSDTLFDGSCSDGPGLAPYHCVMYVGALIESALPLDGVCKRGCCPWMSMFGLLSARRIF